MTDRAWRGVRELNCDQALVLSGESGSGKTEAAKLSLQYLAAVTSHSRDCHAVKYQILQANPVLEGRTNINKKQTLFASLHPTSLLQPLATPLPDSMTTRPDL